MTTKFKIRFLVLFLVSIANSFTALSQQRQLPPRELHGQWFLQALRADGRNVVLNVSSPPPRPRGVSILFLEKDSYHLRSTCNGMGGKYILEEEAGEFKVDTMIRTLIGCRGEAREIEMKLERAFLSVTKYQVKDDSLIFQDESGMNFLKFSRSAQVSTEMTLYVAPKLADCTVIKPLSCLQVKENADDKWRSFYNPVTGFEFKKGYYYILRVRRSQVSSLPNESSRFRFELIEVVKKTKKFAKE